MRKTRILASLLCIMMIVCALPVMQVSAVTTAERNSIGQILGSVSAVPLSGQDFQFASDASTFTSGVTSVTTPGGATYGINGLDLTSVNVANNNASWRYKPTNGYSPFTNGDALVFKAKLNPSYTDSSTGTTYTEGYLNVQAYYSADVNGTATDCRFFVDLYPSQNVKMSSSSIINEFKPGTDWVEYLVMRNGNTGLHLYAKSAATNDEWLLINTVADGSYRTGSNSTGIAFYSTTSDSDYTTPELTPTTHAGAYVQYATVFAASDVVLSDSVNDVMGVSMAKKAYDQQITSTYNSSDAIMSTTASNGTYTDEGLKAGNSCYWTLQPGSGVWDKENATVVKMKMGGVASGSDKVVIQLSDPSSNNYRAEININSGYVYGIGIRNGSEATIAGTLDGATFRLDTNWFELMILNKTVGWDVYVKSDTKTDGVWRQILSMDDYRQKSIGEGIISFNASAANATTYHYIKSVTVYHNPEQKDSVESVLGVLEIASSNAWDFANSTMNSYTRASYNSISSPSGAVYTNEGLNLNETNGTDAWRFSAFNAWSPLRNSNTGSMVYRAAYAKAKGVVTMEMRAPDPYYSVIVSAAPDALLTTPGTGGINHYDIKLDNNWVEYLFVPTSNDGHGTQVWMKSDTLTDGKWMHVLSTATDIASGTDRTGGIQFSGTGVVAGWKIINYTDVNVTTDANTKPATADYLYFDEEFDATPAYQNAGLGSGFSISDDGLASIINSNITLQNVVIPVGGYAEIKVKNNGTQKLEFYDGSHIAVICMYKDYGSLPGYVQGGSYVSDSDTVWRTWRVVRTEDGYSTYSKIDGETGWSINGLNNYDLGVDLDGDGSISTTEEKATPKSTTYTKMNVQLLANCNGTDPGNGQLAYIKVYGPTPSESMTLTDGYSTLALESGETLTYTKSLRAIVNEETGKLLVVSYQGDNMLKAQIVNVADIENNSVIMDARADGADTVKVFLWNDFSTLNNLAPAVTLNL